MTYNNNNNNNNNTFLHNFIELAIDGFLFRGITPFQHYYYFSKSFPQVLTHLSNSKKIKSKQSRTLQQQSKKTISLFNLSSSSNSNILSEQKTRSKSTENIQTLINDQYLTKNSTILKDTLKSNQDELKCLEIEVNYINEYMKKHRLKHNRPDDLSKMTIKQIFDEKTAMQHQLLKFENKYSKPTLNEQKKIMKPIYDYYRQLKRLVENNNKF